MIFSKFSIDLRPAVFVAGLAAAAVTSGVFLYRWQKDRNRQRQKRTVDSSVQTEDLNEPSDQAPGPTRDLVPVPEPVPGPSSTNNQAGQLVPFWNPRFQGIAKNHSSFKTRFSDWFSDGKKIEVVTYHYRASHTGLTSGYTWTVVRNIYKPDPELSTRHIGMIKTMLTIKRLGRQMISLQNHTRIKRVNTILIPGNILKMTAITTVKRVYVEIDGVSWSTETDFTKILEIPVFSRPTTGTYSDVFL